MVVKSKVGGIFELNDLGIEFQPGETLDLSFFATDQQLQQSRELRLALEIGCLIPTNGDTLIPNNFQALISKTMPAADPAGTSIRRALFEDSSIPLDSVSFGFYVMRDLPTKRNIVASTKDLELLEKILVNETDITILATARGRLTKLRQA